MLVPFQTKQKCPNLIAINFDDTDIEFFKQLEYACCVGKKPRHFIRGPDMLINVNQDETASRQSKHFYINLSLTK